MATDQVWTLRHEGRTHRVEAGGSFQHHARWYVDDELVGEKKETADKLTVKPDDDVGQVVVRFSGLGTPRRATFHPPGEDAAALAGLGGVDLVPEEGSGAAAYEQGLRDHPTRYALLATAGGVAKVVLPILLGLLAVRFAVAIPWPDWDLPRIPTPDLPSIPWPSIPWPDLPDLPDVAVPAWLAWLLDKVKYVWPIVLAYVLARAEIKRRRQQDERRREQQDQQQDQQQDEQDEQRD